MRKALFVAAALILATLGNVSAEEMQDAIPARDTAPPQVMLEGGTIAVVPENIGTEALKPGQEVLVIFEENASGEKVATQILILR